MPWAMDFDALTAVVKTDAALARYSVRRSLYAAHAHLTVGVAERNPDEVVSLIWEMVGRLKEPA